MLYKLAITKLAFLGFKIYFSITWGYHLRRCLRFFQSDISARFITYPLICQSRRCCMISAHCYHQQHSVCSLTFFTRRKLFFHRTFPWGSTQSVAMHCCISFSKLQLTNKQTRKPKSKTIKIQTKGVRYIQTGKNKQKSNKLTKKN